MTILITGGAGFIGTELIKALRDRGSGDIVVVDNLHPQVHGEKPVLADHFVNGTAQLVQGDVADPATWTGELSTLRPTTVVHLAAETGTGQSLREATRHTNVNVNGTAVMLDAFSANDHVPDRIILTSSRAVYGEGRWQDPADSSYFYPEPRGYAQLEAKKWEPIAPSGQPAVLSAHRAAEVEPRPTNVYAATKLAQEHVLTAWATALGADLAILRLQNVYGAGQAVGNPYTGVLTYFARELNAGRPINVFEGGDIVRDFVHVSDVVSAIVAAIDVPARAGSVSTMDIGSGEHGTLEHFASVLADAAGGGTVTLTDDYRLGDVRGAYADITDAGATLGYRPRVTFADGAAGLLAWVAQQGA